MPYADKDLSLCPAAVNGEPGTEYLAHNRQGFQGIPGIEKSAAGRLFATFYAGGGGEGPDNYVLLLISDDDGQTWSPPQFVVDPPGLVRAFDPTLWIDPHGRLWWFWAQSYTKYDGRCGVWTSVCDNPDADRISFGEPRRIGNGIMLNKPTVLEDGAWLFPMAVWAPWTATTDLNTLPNECFSNVYRSSDSGKTFVFWGCSDIRDRWFDEHMIVEKQTGELWMLVRTRSGIGQSVSADGGRTWGPGSDTGFGGPNSRFFIRRLQSGNLLLVNHDGVRDRSRLTAFLSSDDGLNWPHKLLLDDRKSVSYPDGVQDSEGRIYITYDRDRQGVGEILLAVFREEDIRARRLVSSASRLRQVIDRLRLPTG